MTFVAYAVLMHIALIVSLITLGSLVWLSTLAGMTYIMFFYRPRVRVSSKSVAWEHLGW